jgi:hypothetical protein
MRPEARKKLISTLIIPGVGAEDKMKKEIKNP